MKLEHQVTNLQLSKKLEELGVPQESVWYHRDGRIALKHQVEDRDGFPRAGAISAFTVAELGELLPARITNPGTRNMDFVRFHKGDDSRQDVRDGYTVEYHTTFNAPLCRVTADTEADARAKMLIYLIENKLIEIAKDCGGDGNCTRNARP